MLNDNTRQWTPAIDWSRRSWKRGWNAALSQLAEAEARLETQQQSQTSLSEEERSRRA